MENESSEVKEKIDDLEDKIEDFKNECEKDNLKSVAKLFKKVRSEKTAEKKYEMFGRALGRIWGIYKNRPTGFLKSLKNFFTKSRYSGIGPLAREVEKFVKKSGIKTEAKKFNNIIEILQKTVNRNVSELCFSGAPEAITSLKFKRTRVSESEARLILDNVKNGIKMEYNKIKDVIKIQSKVFEKFESKYDKMSVELKETNKSS